MSQYLGPPDPVMEENGEEDMEEYFEDTGIYQPLSDSGTTIMFRDMEHELETMVQRYHVPPGDLEKLFQVVQSMFELMDQSKEAYEQLEQQKVELEELWRMEKEKGKVAQRRKLELECRLEEERLKVESEKSTLEKDKVSLETRVRQITAQKSTIEHELQRLKEKTEREEQIRKDLLQEYKKQYESVKMRSLKRKPSQRASRHKLVTTPPGKAAERVHQTPESIQSSEDSFPPSLTSESGVSELTESHSLSLAPPTHREGQSPTSPTAVVSLEDEIRTTKGKQIEPSSVDSKALGSSFLESFEEPVLSDTHSSAPVQSQGTGEGDSEGSLSDGEGLLVAPENAAGFSLEDELMAVDPNLLAPAKAEMEMLQKEKEQWEEERERLQTEKQQVRQERETLESNNAQLQLEISQLQKRQQELQDELNEVRKERDEVLENYLDQPFDEYCITRKELHELLKKHHKTAIELEKEKEEKLRLQRLLETKKTLFERFKMRMKRLFSRDSRQPSSTPSSSDRHRSSTPSEETLDKSSTSPPPLSPPPTSPSPLTRSLALVVTRGEFVAMKGWLLPQGGTISVEGLPVWMGQIPLKGIETERIECAAVGRVYHTVEGLAPGSTTPPCSRASRRYTMSGVSGISFPSVRQLHAEVWVATSCEGSVAYIEVIDVLAKPAKVRQRFVIRSKTKHVACMKAIPGCVEESSEFTDAATRSLDTRWVVSSYTQGTPAPLSNSKSPADLVHSSPNLLARPHSAPTSRRRLGSPNPSGRSERELQASPLETSQTMTRSTGITGQSMTASATQTSAASISGSVATTSQTSKTSPIDTTGVTTPSSGSRSSPISITSKTGRTSSFGGSSELDTSVSTLTESRSLPKDDYLSPPEGGWGGNGGGKSPLAQRLEFSSPSQAPSGRTDWTALSTRSEPGILMSERVDQFRARNRAMHEGRVFHGVIPEDPVPGSGKRESDPAEMGEDFPDFELRKRRTSGRNDTLVMWLITEDDRLYFYPTTDPSHTPINCVKLQSKALCIEYIKEKVYIGHCQSQISVYYWDEFSGSWDVENPERIALPSPDPGEHVDVRCIAEVGDRLWVGAGPSIFLLDAETHSREGSIFMDSWRRRPEHIIAVGDSVVVATRGSALYIYDAKSARLVRKFDVSPITKLLENPQGTLTVPTDIKSLVMDEKNIYVGTSNGKIVAIPTAHLRASSINEPLTVAPVTPDGEAKESTKVTEEPDGVFQEQSSISLHSHKDHRVKTLLHIPLPRSRPARDNPQLYTYSSLPNLSSYRPNLSHPLYKSVILSAGKGHVEYSVAAEVESVDNSAARERNEAFQLLVWGHRNTIS